MVLIKLCRWSQVPPKTIKSKICFSFVLKIYNSVYYESFLIIFQLHVIKYSRKEHWLIINNSDNLSSRNFGRLGILSYWPYLNVYLQQNYNRYLASFNLMEQDNLNTKNSSKDNFLLKKSPTEVTIKMSELFSQKNF